MSNAMWRAQQDLMARQREYAQAQPRPSRVRFTVLTKGVGETRLDGVKGINFGAALLEEPTFSFGVVARRSLDLGEVPLATAVVLRWEVDAERGFYFGADMGFRVESARTDIRLKFTLTFEATALRSTYGLEG